MLPLRAIAVFHAAARAGSLTRAAQELGVTPSAVSQQVSALEVQLGTALLTRQGRRIALTEAGQRYLEMIAPHVERIAEATRYVRGSLSSGSLILRATPSFATKWLLPRLPAFLDAHPEIELRVDATNEPTDFAREGVDLEVRHGEGDWPGLVVEPVAEEVFLPVCAPALAAPGSLRAEELGAHRLIHSVKSQVKWAAWFAAAGTPMPAARRVLFDRSHMAVDAAIAGMGIALESTLMMGDAMADGRLACPVAAPPAIRRTTQWLVCPADRMRRHRVRAFADWLRAEALAWREQSLEKLKQPAENLVCS
ncbi:LysR family transcriptional regulator [Roseomonas sp. PWR1]|uniref:LysR family transcriptional regulator n=1 Tax=Roseomonas nitratireducens TaxID=2820810 RepID=A0ABS4AUN9_9PROT|nr:LysR substrate-binding domain-containing protein [Neoroseomonas nitratireducens]MBP0465080.1 LysR family transcriptional regulator [Neoroseomonas nitratireducens]